MPVSFDVKCAGATHTMTVNDDGSINIEGYDPAQEEMMAFMTGQYEFSICYQIARHWNDILAKLQASGQRGMLEESIGETYYDNDRSTGYRDVRRAFGINDLGEFLAEQLRDYVKSENYEALPIAQVLAKLPVRFDWTPDIEIDSFEEDPDGWGVCVLKKITHTLKVCNTEIASWEHMTEREVFDIFTFDTSTTDFLKDHDFEYLGPSPFVVDVLEALGLEDPEPTPPDEDAMGTPKADPAGEGAFGVMYETRAWNPKLHGDRGGYDDSDITEVVVIVYQHEYDARDAANLATRINNEHGDDQYRITAVRRRAPSERQVGLFEEQDLDPIYYEWTDLEKHSRDFPDDFEG